MFNKWLILILCLSCSMLSGCGPKYKSEAENKYRAAAERGDAEAQFNLGACYNDGSGVEKDLRKAALWYGKAVEQGHEKAKFCLLRCKAQQGDAEAQYELAFLLGAESPKEALYWIKKAADQGHKQANFILNSELGRKILFANPRR